MVAQLVAAMRYTPEGREFDSRWGYWDLHDTSGCNMAFGSTQSLLEMSNRDIYWVVKAAGT